MGGEYLVQEEKEDLPIEKLLEEGSSKAQKEVNRKSNEKNKGKEKSKTKIQGK